MALSTKTDGHYYIEWECKLWLTDQCLQGCSYGAKGLWMDLLMLMFDRNPRGVLPGDLGEVARLLRARVGSIRGLLGELEERGVFSRGCEMGTDLAGDAIVNRRMFRGWLRREQKRVAGRKGGEARGYSKRQADGVAGSVDSIGGCGSRAEAGGGQGFDYNNQNDSSGDKPLPSESTSESYIRTVPVPGVRGRGIPIAIESVLQQLYAEAELGADRRPAAVGLQRIVTRIICVTGDALAEALWRKFALAFSRDGELFAVFLGEICEFEDSLRRGPVRNMGAVLTARLQACAGRLGVRI